MAFTPFRPVPRTGVIYVSEEASNRGYTAHHPDWSNLGQGQPEAGALPAAPPRVEAIPIGVDDQEYAPVGGLRELRDAVAQLYNELYRRGRRSRYSAENVAICGGGRVSLARVLSAVGHINVGHFLPDYTAYGELLDVFRAFNPIPIMLDPQSSYRFDADALRTEIVGRGLGAVLVSNPCNPTGSITGGAELAGWAAIARELDCALIMDEFYSNYVWNDALGTTVSAAEHVEDVERERVIILNGLTKAWRYPGWRLSWVLGPRDLIETVVSAGSFLDGGGNRPLQRAALPLVNAQHFLDETRAIQTTFAAKRARTLEALSALGVRVAEPPQGTFYVWGDLAQLPPPLNDGMALFRRALERKVIVIPGQFFDVNPGNRRPHRGTRFDSFARFSFGPSMAELERGLARLGQLVADARAGSLAA